MASDSFDVFEKNAHENGCIEPNSSEFASTPSKRKSRNAGGVRKVERRGKSVWVIDIRFVIADGPNKGKPARYRRDAEVQSAAAAKAELRRRLAALAATGSPFEIVNPIVKAQLLPHSQKPAFTFGNALDEWLAEYVPTRKAATQFTYQGVAHRYLNKLREIPLKEIGAVHVREIQKRDREAGRSIASTIQTIICIRSVLAFAVEKKHLETKPVLPSIRRGHSKEIQTYTDEEVQALIGACRSPLERRLILLACFAGLRTAEIRGLRWQDIDFNRRTLTVRQAITRGPGKNGRASTLCVEKPKSSNERTIPLHESLYRELCSADMRDARGLICPHHDGGPLGVTRLYVIWGQILGRAGVRRIPSMVHAGRHYFGTSLCRARVNVRAVQKLLGHADVTMTMRYVHAVSKDLEDAIGELETLTLGAKKGRDRSEASSSEGRDRLGGLLNG